MQPDWRLVVFAESGKAFAVPEGRLVPRRGYEAAVLAGADSPARKAAMRAASWCVWRSEIWVEGLWSMAFWFELKALTGRPTAP